LWLLLFFLALGLAGTERLALASAPAHAAEEDAASDVREEQTLRNSASKRKTRDKKARRAFVNLPSFFGSTPTTRPGFLYLGSFQPDSLQADNRPFRLQVFRI